MEPQMDLLTDLNTDINLEPVSAGVRFVNYIVDIIAFYALIFLIAIAFGSIAPAEDILVYLYLFVFVIFLGYYIIMEGALGGRTFGKMVTGTKAIREDGAPLTWKDALVRTLLRMIPFEPFSALGGHPWHDKWSKTVVVKNRKTY